MKDSITVIVIALVLIAVLVGGFMVNRWWNYNVPFGYEDQVRQTIIEMVKPEALIQ